MLWTELQKTAQSPQGLQVHSFIDKCVCGARVSCLSYTNSTAYGNWRFNAAFTRVLQ